MSVTIGVPFSDGGKIRSVTGNVDGHAAECLRPAPIAGEREIRY